MASNEKIEVLSRRRFLVRSAKAGVCAGFTCAAGLFFHTDTATPFRSTPQKVRLLPDFSLTERSPRMAVARGPNRGRTFRKAIGAMGGMSTIIEKGDRVLLKVNAAFASPPLLSATTHPDLLESVIHLCLEAGASSVTITDNPINDPAACFALTGIGKIARQAGARVMAPREHWFKKVSVKDGRLIRAWPVLYEPLRDIDKLIGIAPVKDHHRSGASMTMKNWYGLLGGRRNVFHQDIHNIIKELAVMVRPSLVILDGTVTMMRNGPTGGSLSDLRQTDTLIVSTDQVAADAFGATLLEKSVDSLAFIKKAERAGAGTAAWRSLNPVFV